MADGLGLGDGHCTGARRGAPPPTPPRSFLAERGEFGGAPDTLSGTSAGAPSGSLRLATSPKTAWGGWGCRWDRGATNSIELRPTRPPLPRPSPLRSAPRSGRKGRTRSRSGTCVSRPTSPGSFGGGGRVMRARRGRPAHAPKPAEDALEAFATLSTLSHAWDEGASLSERVRAWRVRAPTSPCPFVCPPPIFWPKDPWAAALCARAPLLIHRLPDCTVPSGARWMPGSRGRTRP